MTPSDKTTPRRRGTLARALIALVAAVGALYAGAIVWLMVQEAQTGL